MKILGIVGSGRDGGNTEILVTEALATAKENGADETKLIKLTTYKIDPCDGCGICKDTGNCRIDDGMQKIYPEILDADGIIIGSPVYFWNISGQTKIFIDRTYPFIHKRRLRDKVGGAIVVSTRAGCSNAFLAISSFFMIQRMRVVGGAICYGAKIGEVRNDRRGLTEVKALGRLITTLR
jgi:multimeric flavodoxin WrbA